MRRLIEYLRLCRRHPRLGVTASVAVVLARLALWLLPFSFLRRLAASRRGEESASANTHGARRLRIASAVRIVSHLVPAATCLTQALAAQALLRLRGDWANLCLGVTRGDQGEFKAHAWLEANGKIVIGDAPDLAGYRQFPLTSSLL